MFEGIKTIWNKLTGKTKPAMPIKVERDAPSVAKPNPAKAYLTDAAASRAAKPFLANRQVEIDRAKAARISPARRNDDASSDRGGSILGMGPVGDAAALGSLFNPKSGTSSASVSSSSNNDSFSGGGNGSFGGGGASGSWDSGSSSSSSDYSSSSSYDSGSGGGSFDITCAPGRETLLHRSRAVKQALSR